MQACRVSALALLVVMGGTAVSAQADVPMAGAIQGQASISPTGVAAYSIPVSVPPSLAGVGPSLSIEYSSQAQSGLLGVGWNIGGLQQITRCPQTRAQDNALTGVSFTATDRFCLGGQRLVKVAGAAYGADGAEYYTEIDSFSKIISYGVAGSGPQYFKIWTKDGQVMEFGSTADSRLPVNFTDAAGMPTSQATVQAWSLNRITDRKTNYWTAAYSHDVGTGMLYPVRIDYAGNTMVGVAPANSVQFEYESRTAQDTSLQFQAGSRVIFSKRLKTLRTYAGTAQAAEYRFAYEATDAGGQTYNQSRLKSLTECHYKAGAPNCLESTNLEWTSDASFNVIDVTSTKRAGSLAGIPPTAFTSLVGDINGDGRADIVYANTTSGVLRVRSMLANTGPAASDFGAAVVSQPTGTYAVDIQSFTLADVNLDGKADLILGSIGAAGFKVYTLFSNGDGTFAPATAATTTNISTSALSESYRFAVTDVNSDGLSDYAAIFADTSTAVMRVALRAANGTFGSEQVTTLKLSAWTGEVVWDSTIADIDGDGFPDTVIAVSLSNNDYGTYIAKGTGTGTFATTPVAVIAASAAAIADQTDSLIRGKANYNPASYHFVLQDVNRDGLVDVVLDMAMSQAYCSGTGCPANPVLDQCKVYGCSHFFQGTHVALSKGNMSFKLEGGFPSNTGAVASSTITGWLPTYGDVDGDGALDVIRVNLDATYKPWILISFGMGNGDFYLPVGGNIASAPLVATAGLSPGVGTVAVQNDVNADGVADIIIPLVYKNTADGEAIAAHVTRVVKDGTLLPQQQNLLSRIKQGLQFTEEFDYKTLPSSSALYVKESTETYPRIDLNAPLFAVAQARSKLNGVLQKTTDYHYEGAKADLNGRGFLGFRKSKSTTTRVATLPGGGTQTLTEEQETTFRQDFPYIGQPLLTTRKANGILVMQSESNVSTDFTVTNPYPGVYFPRAIKTLQSVFDPVSGTLLFTTEQVLGHDAYGNVLTQTATTRNAGQTESFVTTTLDTYFPADVNAWKIDLLQAQQVTSQRTNRPDIVRQISRDYDASGVLKQEIVEPNTPALRVQTDYARDAYGNVGFVTISGAGDSAYPATAIESRTTEMRYEAGTGYPAGVFKTTDINPLTHTVSRTFDPLTGAVLTETDANMLTTTLTYDALGRETSRSNPDGTQTVTVRATCSSFVVVGSGTTACETGEYLKVTMTQTGSAPAYIFLDGAGRTVRQVSSAFDGTNYIISRTEYDEAGRVKRASKPAFSTMTYASLPWASNEYDSVGRPTKQTLPGGRVTATAYSGLVTTTTNPNAQVRIETRNAAGEVAQVEDASHYLLKYELDALGRINKAIDPYSYPVVFALDKLGRKTQQIDPDLGTWNYRYNVLGELVWQQDAKGQVTTFTYDKLGRPRTRTEPDLNSTWTWDTAPKGIGQLAKLASDNAFERNYSYDAFGRPIQAITKKTIDPNAQASDPDFVHSTNYDSAGRPETITYPTGFGYNNVYDTNGYLSEVRNKSSNALYWRATTRDAEGRVTRETLGNGLVSDRKYKVDTGYIDTVQTGVLSGSTLTASVQNDAYSFDALGNLTTRSQYFGSTSLSESFGYDALNRLTSATLLGGTTKTVSYDITGNIYSRSDVGSYVYSGCGGAHRVCYIGFSPLISYDANGNMLSGNGRSLTWTSYNYPVQISQGTSTESFLYTPERERVRRTSVENGQTTTTVYLNPRIDLGNTFEKTYNPNGTVEYTHHIYADGQVIGSVVTTTTTQQTRYFHADHLGSLMAVTDATGAVVERMSFDAWGKRRYPDSSGDTCNVLSGETTQHGFTLHEHLDSVDLVHMNGRVYDPLIGRFLSADPNVFYPDNRQDFNRYSYVHNNPLSYTDPSGFVSYVDGIYDTDPMDFALGNAIYQSQITDWNNAFNFSLDNLYSFDLSNASTGVFSPFGANYGTTGMSEMTALFGNDFGGSVASYETSYPGYGATEFDFTRELGSFFSDWSDQTSREFQGIDWHAAKGLANGSSTSFAVASTGCLIAWAACGPVAVGALSAAGLVSGGVAVGIDVAQKGAGFNEAQAAGWMGDLLMDSLQDTLMKSSLPGRVVQVGVYTLDVSGHAGNIVFGAAAKSEEERYLQNQIIMLPPQ